MSTLFHALRDLQVPEAEILAEADGNQSAALQMAAAFGYATACRDLDQVATHRPVAPAAHG